MNFSQYLYNSLPSIYRSKDKEVGYTLKRYLEAQGDAMDTLSNETLGILSLLDVEKMDEKFLPFYASMFGFTYDYDVPIETQRRLLANIINLYKRKGTLALIEFIAREITGMEATVVEGHKTLFKTWTDKPDDDIASGYTPPTTYGGINKIFHFACDKPTSNTNRFNIRVSLESSKSDEQEVFLNTQLISRYATQLVQPYIKLKFKSYLRSSDEYDLNINETYITIIKDTGSNKCKVIEGKDYSRVTQREQNTYSSKQSIQDVFIDNFKLLKDKDIEAIITSLNDYMVDDFITTIDSSHDIACMDITTVLKDTLQDDFNDPARRITTLEAFKDCFVEPLVESIINSSVNELEIPITDKLKMKELLASIDTQTIVEYLNKSIHIAKIGDIINLELGHDTHKDIVTDPNVVIKAKNIQCEHQDKIKIINKRRK